MMSDVKKYVEERSKNDREFALNFDSGYEDFKIGVLLRQVREAAGLTQEELARKMNTKKSVISRMENHADDIRLSTLRRYAEALGADIKIRVEQPRL
jgi:ribosome-binding protein aMBF1 (putative translation factor)